MDRNDWIDLLAERLSDNHTYISDTNAVTVLDTRIPAACPDCKGTGELGDIPELRIPSVSCDHPNAPTVEQVLTVGLRTLSAYHRKGGTAMHATVYLPGDGPKPRGFTQAARLLDALKENP